MKQDVRRKRFAGYPGNDSGIRAAYDCEDGGIRAAHEREGGGIRKPDAEGRDAGRVGSDGILFRAEVQAAV